MSFNAYAYDFNRMSMDILDLIIEECREQQNKYQIKYLSKNEKKTEKRLHL